MALLEYVFTQVIRIKMAARLQTSMKGKLKMANFMVMAHIPLQMARNTSDNLKKTCILGQGH